MKTSKFQQRLIEARNKAKGFIDAKQLEEKIAMTKHLRILSRMSLVNKENLNKLIDLSTATYNNFIFINPTSQNRVNLNHELHLNLDKQRNPYHQPSDYVRIFAQFNIMYSDKALLKAIQTFM